MTTETNNVTEAMIELLTTDPEGYDTWCGVRDVLYNDHGAEIERGFLDNVYVDMEEKLKEEFQYHCQGMEATDIACIICTAACADIDWKAVAKAHVDRYLKKVGVQCET